MLSTYTINTWLTIVLQYIKLDFLNTSISSVMLNINVDLTIKCGYDVMFVYLPPLWE